MAVTVRGVRELKRRLDAIDDTRVMLKKLQEDTVREAKHLVPRKTGNLGRSIKTGYLSSTKALVVADAPYAAAVELGTKPHEIVPKRRRALRFAAGGVSTTLAGRVRVGEARRLGKGAFVFATKVNHPGTKAKPYLLPGAKKAATGNGLPETIVKLWNGAA